MGRKRIPSSIFTLMTKIRYKNKSITVFPLLIAQFFRIKSAKITYPKSTMVYLPLEMFHEDQSLLPRRIPPVLSLGTFLRTQSLSVRRFLEAVQPLTMVPIRISRIRITALVTTNRVRRMMIIPSRTSTVRTRSLSPFRQA